LIDTPQEQEMGNIRMEEGESSKHVQEKASELVQKKVRLEDPII
jgi:hypothetical protein